MICMLISTPSADLFLGFQALYAQLLPVGCSIMMAPAQAEYASHKLTLFQNAIFGAWFPISQISTCDILEQFSFFYFLLLKILTYLFTIIY